MFEQCIASQHQSGLFRNYIKDGMKNKYLIYSLQTRPIKENQFIKMQKYSILIFVLALTCSSFATNLSGESTEASVSSEETQTQTPTANETGLCQGKGEGLWRYHKKTKECHQVGEKGPCGEMMIFYGHPNNEEMGECDCDIKLRCHRPLVYWKKAKRCYYMFDQGPCNQGHWLNSNKVFYRRGSSKRFIDVKCEENPCAKQDTEVEQRKDEDFWFERFGQCYQEGTQGFCKYPNEQVHFTGLSKHVEPECSVAKTSCEIPDSAYTALPCLPGQKFSDYSGCRKYLTATYNKEKLSYTGRKSGKLSAFGRESKRKHRHRPHHHHNHHHNHHHHSSVPMTTPESDSLA